MKITMITGSPHKNGTTNLLAKRFMEGAQEAGHTVVRIDAAHEDLHPCLACDYCVRTGTVCVQKDAMESIRNEILNADLIALVSPMYYFGMSAQIKTVIDRFYAFNAELLANPKKSVFLAVCGDDEDWIDDAMLSHYKTICRYLGWEDVGTIMARGYYQLEDIQKSDYPRKAYELGKSL